MVLVVDVASKVLQITTALDLDLDFILFHVPWFLPIKSTSHKG